MQKNSNIFCSHSGICGGCRLQNLTYAKQLEYKQQKLQTVLSDIYSKNIAVTPSVNEKYYRNKMEFGFVRQIDKEKTTPDTERFFEQKLGQKEKNRWDRAFNLEECYLMSAESVKLIADVRAWAENNNFEYYDLRKHTGVLRHLMVREAKNTTDKMVVLFVTESNFDKKEFIDAVLKSYPATSIILSENKKLSDKTFFENTEILYGQDFITEKIILPSFEKNGQKFNKREISFKISAESFFQTNTKTAEILYAKVRKLTSELKPEIIYDLYGGSGSFSLVCADTTEKCVCVEEVSSSIKDGKHNADLNKVSNMEFINEKTEIFLKELNIKENSTVILDPPRCGLHPKALAALLNLKPKNIIYVSCKPETLTRDLKELSLSYKIKNIEGFDLFPHTEHIETLSFLTLN